MSAPFLHDDREFGSLIRIVADERSLSESIVEKDYWVTHCLWALKESGLGLYFKGGTSLSKGFGIIERFSEDVDLTINAGMRKGLPGLGSLRSDSPGATQKRRAFFEALALDIPGAEKIVLLHPQDGRWINVEYEVYYPKRFDVPSSMRPFVRLEPGLRPWRPPTILKDLSSFLHQHVDSVGLRTAYADNRPSGIECVHPFVTLVEKLDSVTKRYGRAQFAAEEFARHYEDLAHLVSKIGDPEPLSEATKLEVVDHCLAARSVLPDDPAFVLADPEKRALLERAYAAIAPMFWGERISLDACCERVARWLTENPLRPNRGEAGS